MQTLVDHALSAWCLNRIEIRLTPENRRSLAVVERLGFEDEATLRKAQRLGDRSIDLAIYSLLPERPQRFSDASHPKSVAAD